MPTYLERYRNGEREQVWAELQAQGPAVRRRPLRSDALAVARETMTRARQNVEQLILRLLRLGYKFEYPHAIAGPADLTDEVVYAPPRSDVRKRIAELERLAGALPLSLRACYEIVGAVNFVGVHRDWPATAYSDPLVVTPIEIVLRLYYDEKGYNSLDETAGDSGLESTAVLEDDDAAEDYAGFDVIIAPDYYHKYHISGGPPYRMHLPAPTIDAPLLNEWHETTFVNYLRICFQWGGFPGFARYKKRPTSDLAFLSKDLLPI